MGLLWTRLQPSVVPVSVGFIQLMILVDICQAATFVTSTVVLVQVSQHAYCAKHILPVHQMEDAYFRQAIIFTSNSM